MQLANRDVQMSASSLIEIKKSGESDMKNSIEGKKETSTNQHGETPAGSNFKKLPKDIDVLSLWPEAVHQHF